MKMLHIDLLKTLVSRICHDLMNPIGAIKMLLSVDPSIINNPNEIEAPINETLQTLDILRNMLNTNLNLNHVQKIITSPNLSIEIEDDYTKPYLANILLLLSLTLLHKQKKFQITISNKISVQVDLHSEEIQALENKSLSAYTIYLYLIKYIYPTVTIEYVNNTLTLY